MIIAYRTQTAGNNAVTAARMMAAARRQAERAAIAERYASMPDAWRSAGVERVFIEAEYFDGGRSRWAYATEQFEDAADRLLFIRDNPDFVTLSDFEQS